MTKSKTVQLTYSDEAYFLKNNAALFLKGKQDKMKKRERERVKYKGKTNNTFQNEVMRHKFMYTVQWLSIYVYVAHFPRFEVKTLSMAINHLKKKVFLPSINHKYRSHNTSIQVAIEHFIVSVQYELTTCNPQHSYFLAGRSVRLSYAIVFTN